MSNASDYVKANRGIVAVVAGALVIGAGAGYWLSRGPVPSGGKPDQPIEWNQVQAVPSRAPDVDDNEWQDRVDALDNAAAPAAGPTNNEPGPDTAALENSNA